MVCYARSHFGIARGLFRADKLEKSEKFLRRTISIYKNSLANRNEDKDTQNLFVEYLQVYNRYAMTLISMNNRLEDTERILTYACRILNNYMGLSVKDKTIFDVCIIMSCVHRYIYFHKTNGLELNLSHSKYSGFTIFFQGGHQKVKRPQRTFKSKKLTLYLDPNSHIFVQHVTTIAATSRVINFNCCAVLSLNFCGINY